MELIGASQTNLGIHLFPIHQPAAFADSRVFRLGLAEGADQAGRRAGLEQFARENDSGSPAAEHQRHRRQIGDAHGGQLLEAQRAACVGGDRTIDRRWLDRFGPSRCWICRRWVNSLRRRRANSSRKLRSRPRWARASQLTMPKQNRRLQRQQQKSRKQFVSWIRSRE